MTPVDAVAAAFGGVPALSRATGIPKAAIYRWACPRGGRHHGCGGMVPQWHYRAILDAADRLDIPLPLEHLVFGRSDVRIVRRTVGTHRRAVSAFEAMAAVLETE